MTNINPKTCFRWLCGVFLAMGLLACTVSPTSVAPLPPDPTPSLRPSLTPTLPTPVPPTVAPTAHHTAILPSATPSLTPLPTETLQLTRVTVPLTTQVALPTLTVRDVYQTSAEEDMRYLVGQWLEGFKTVRTTSLIRAYRIDRVTLVPLLREDHDYCIIAKVEFSIEPVAIPPSNNWASVLIREEGPWYRLGMTFGATCLRNVLKLRPLPHLGT